MLIHPKTGSTFFLAEILLGVELEPDEPFATDHCGTCTRCIDACPTQCILSLTAPSTHVVAISYLTIELKDDIPEDLRDKMGNGYLDATSVSRSAHGINSPNRQTPPSSRSFRFLFGLDGSGRRLLPDSDIRWV